MSYRYDEDYEDVPARRVKKPAGEGAQRGGEEASRRKASLPPGASSREGDAKAAAGKARPSSKAAKPAPEGGAKKRPAPSAPPVSLATAIRRRITRPGPSALQGARRAAKGGQSHYGAAVLGTGFGFGLRHQLFRSGVLL